MIIVVTQTWCDSTGKPLSSDQIKDIVGNDFYEEYGDSAIAFRNSYRATSVKLKGDTALGGKKTLVGRDMKDGETFSFALSGADPDTKKAIDGGDIVIKGYDNKTAQATATITGATNREKTAFAFDEATFNKIGTYKFSIKEQVPDQDSDGMTWDRHKATAMVTVTDNNGQLEATVAYSDTTTSIGTVVQKAYIMFRMDYSTGGGLVTSKGFQIGRQMEADEFHFMITAGERAPAEMAAAEAKLQNSDGILCKR